MDIFDKKCSTDPNLSDFNNQQKYDLAEILFRTFVSTYKNNLNQNEIEFILYVMSSIILFLNVLSLILPRSL